MKAGWIAAGWLAIALAVLLLLRLWRRAAAQQALLSHRITEMDGRLAAQQAALDRAEAARSEASAELRSSEERYALALRGSQDGLWEWDLASGRVLLSPRWRSMLGLAPGDVAEDKAGWLARVHPQDRPGLERALALHLADPESRFDHEMRLLHQDGSVRWVLSRGVAIRHAGGAPYRMVGLDTDVTRLRRVQTVLEAVTEGTAGAFGEQFFPAMVQHFARALGVDCAFVTECADQPPTRLRTLAFWSDGALRENFEYALPGTPCETVVSEGSTCFHRSRLGERFPREAGFEAYLGLPIIASDRRVVGHLAFLDTRPLGDEMLLESIYRIFLARAAAEIERRQALERLRLSTATAATRPVNP